MRLHLFEFLDQPWLPDHFRSAITSYLVASYRQTPLPGLWAANIASVLRSSGQLEIVDLCSGAMGPIRIVATELDALGLKTQITMTDLYPPTHQVGAAAGSMRYWPDPVDARSLPPSLNGTRTLFAAFHHFRPADAAAILRDAFVQRRGICIFEATARTPASMALALLIPIMVLVTTPSIRPLSLFQLLFTYLLPLLPCMIFWDGLVSQFRTYTPEEMLVMTKELTSENYRWTVDTISLPGLPVALPYLTGCPVPAPPNSIPSL